MIGCALAGSVLELGPQPNGCDEGGDQTRAHRKRIPKGFLSELTFFGHKLAGLGHEFPDFDLELIEFQIIAVIL
jgi:hypothetical protein